MLVRNVIDKRVTLDECAARHAALASTAGRRALCLVFLDIYPFQGGNGRLSRVLMSLLSQASKGDCQERYPAVVDPIPWICRCAMWVAWRDLGLFTTAALLGCSIRLRPFDHLLRVR